MWPLEIFLASFLAATILPFSSEALFVYLQYKGVNPLGLLLLASLGNFLGGLTCFYMGKLGKLEWCSKYLRIKKESIDKWQSKINKRGEMLALLCWLPAVGDPLAVGLGYFRCSLGKVAIYMFIGKFLRYAMLMLIPLASSYFSP